MRWPVALRSTDSSATGRRMGHRLACLALGSTLAAAVFGGPALAKTDPAVGCAAFKLKRAGATASAELACHAAAAQKGLAVDPECLSGAAEKLATAFAKAEAAAKKAGSACPAG